MCGPTTAETNLNQEQADFYKEATQEATQAYGAQSAITGALTSAFTPILQAGPNQEGFSPGQTQTLNTENTENVAQAYQQSSAALGKQIGAQGGGNEFLPSGSDTELAGENSRAAANTLASNKNTINLQNYAQGNANFNTAAGVLGQTAATINPAAFTSAATGAGSSAASLAENIAQQSTSPWLTAISALGGIAGKAVGGINYSSGAGFSFGGGS